MKNFRTIKELPDSEKPYEKFQNFGPGALSDAELLAVIIKSGAQGQKSVDVAQDFLNIRSRSLLNLYDVSYEEMQKIRGIGKVKALQLKCIGELCARIGKAKHKDSVCMDSPQTVARYYMEVLRHEKQEKLVLCMFDAKCKLLQESTLFVGSASCSIVSPREIFLTALGAKAIHIILLHNHPSGSPEPSGEDDMVTERIAQCGQMLGIGLSDHIIIGDNIYYSYRENNRIVCG